MSAPFDPQMACLTVGDAGAAFILEQTDNPDTGFHDHGAFYGFA